MISLYDPGYSNTACCVSSICDIDGGKGKLSYRGYPIEELVEKSTFVEVSYLLIYGSLPDAVQLDNWTRSLMRHSFLHNNLGAIMGQFRYDAHPCGMLISSVAALGTFFPEANPALKGLDVFTKSPEVRDRQVLRLLGKMPTIAAQSYRHRLGRPYNTPMSSQDLTPLSYTENFLYMLDRLSENQYRPHPTLVRFKIFREEVARANVKRGVTREDTEGAPHSDLASTLAHHISFSFSLLHPITL